MRDKLKAACPVDVIAHVLHRCDWCYTLIKPGEKHKQWTSFGDDLPHRTKVHLDCFDAITSMDPCDLDELWGYASRGHTHEGREHHTGCPGCYAEMDHLKQVSTELAEKTWEINRAFRLAYDDVNASWEDATEEEKHRQIGWVTHYLCHPQDGPEILAPHDTPFERLSPENQAKFRIMVEVIRQFAPRMRIPVRCRINANAG